jgi:hypothetical protein
MPDWPQTIPYDLYKTLEAADHDAWRPAFQSWAKSHQLRSSSNGRLIYCTGLAGKASGDGHPAFRTAGTLSVSGWWLMTYRCRIGCLCGPRRTAVIRVSPQRLKSENELLQLSLSIRARKSVRLQLQLEVSRYSRDSGRRGICT